MHNLRPQFTTAQDDDAANAAEHLFKMLNRDLSNGDDTTSQEIPQPRAVTVTAGEDLIQVMECYCPDSEQAGMRVHIRGLRALLSPSSATGRVVTTPCRYDNMPQGVHYASILLNGWAMARYHSREPCTGVEDLATYRDAGQMFEYPKAVNDDVRSSVAVLAARLSETENDRWAGWCSMWAYVKSEHDVGLGHLRSTDRSRKYLPHSDWLTLNALDTASESLAYDTVPFYREDSHGCLVWARLFDDLLDVNRDLQTGELFSLARGMTVGVHQKLVKLCIAAFNGYASPRASRLTAGIAWASAIWYLCAGRHEIWRQWQGVETESSECELCAVGSADPLQAIWGNGEVEITVCGHGGMEDDGSETMLVVTQALLLLSVLDQAHTGDLTADEWRAHKDHHTAKVDVLSIAAQVTSALQRFNVIQEASHRFGADKTFDKMWVIFYTTHLIVRFDTRLRDAAQAYVDSNAADMYEAMWLGTDEIYGRLAAYLAASAHPHWAYRPILNVAAPGRGGDY
ncbi:hypothetical protein BGZ75_008160 [Mortierella antarctica]|nr:hypothetical protein BGZ75_008160 [Mortierella antarctica]